MRTFFSEGDSVFARLVKTAAVFCAMGLLLALTGCASANVDVLSRPQTQLAQPDFVLVYDCAVSASEVNLDHGFAATAIRDSSELSQSEQELQVGHAVAKALTDGIVENLRQAGIRAAKASEGYKPSNTTLVLTGKFVKIDQGNQTMRVLIGFGLGGGEV